MKIKYAATIHNSRRDIYGNCYWAVTVTRTRDGKTAQGRTSGGGSNIRYALYSMGGSGGYTYSEDEMPIREFNRFVKDLPYVGCHPDDIATNLLAQFRKRRTA